MNAGSDAPSAGPARGELRLETLLGRRVFGRNNRSVGRIEEFRSEVDARGCRVTEYVLGGAGLLERLHLGVRLLFGARRVGGYVARWDQIDISDPARPRLTCPVAELRTE